MSPSGGKVCLGLAAISLEVFLLKHANNETDHGTCFNNVCDQSASFAGVVGTPVTTSVPNLSFCLEAAADNGYIEAYLYDGNAQLCTLLYEYSAVIGTAAPGDAYGTLEN